MEASKCAWGVERLVLTCVCVWTLIEGDEVSLCASKDCQARGSLT